MKYGLFFSAIGILLAAKSVSAGGAYLLLFWPAGSFVLVGSAYLFFGPSVFGKQSNGRLSLRSTVVLLLYLIYTWMLWRFLRLVRREDSHNELFPGVLIGRRLLPAELPSEVDLVVDLTCEFPEPSRIVEVIDYRSIPDANGNVRFCT